ncbi:MAG: hypothetical protein QNJ46_24930 [Leptolyngbyaceae cyanobacterium MO_188.B28]|nr:hypothetical protein [Leptolyngbyaceae cyanobacterium MO_188.B28]
MTLGYLQQCCERGAIAPDGRRKTCFIPYPIQRGPALNRSEITQVKPSPFAIKHARKREIPSTGG